ncbi:MAG: MoaD/ThiS family protein [Crocinitomicaceae bacterium]|nr:MoaD/ThiS family protein [Crocinitomicaceae bacterium]
MILQLKYFGQISEATGIQEETITIQSEISVDELKSILEKKYINLKSKTYQCAGDFKLTDNCEIAFLPPFAGE